MDVHQTRAVNRRSVGLELQSTWVGAPLCEARCNTENLTQGLLAIPILLLPLTASASDRQQAFGVHSWRAAPVCLTAAGYRHACYCDCLTGPGPDRPFGSQTTLVGLSNSAVSHVGPPPAVRHAGSSITRGMCSSSLAAHA